MGGLLETIQHNKTGILVSPTNKKELISALVKICNDKEFANKLGENANKLVLEKFNFKETVSAFEKEFLNAYEFFKKI